MARVDAATSVAAGDACAITVAGTASAAIEDTVVKSLIYSLASRGGLEFDVPMGIYRYYFGVTRNNPPVLAFSIIHTAPSGATATSRIW